MSTKIFTTRFCGFCHRAKQLLDSKGAAYQEVAVDGDYETRAKLVELTGQTTVPQIWIGDNHVGGCDDLFALEREGRLDQMLAANA